MVTPIRFGTDGWRAIIAEDYTFQNVRICAQSVAEYLLRLGKAQQGLVVGYDTRFGSEYFAAAVAEVVAANGVRTFLCQTVAPTPVISYSILTQKAAGAVIITASHNPAVYNGLKYKPEYAGSASPEVVAELERGIDRIQAEGGVQRMPLADALRQQRVVYIDPKPAYIEQIVRLVDLEAIKAAGLKVVVDSMYGAGAGYTRILLDGGKTQVCEINDQRNPAFPDINPEPIAQHLGKLSQAVRGMGAQVGLATDGDADRLGVMDEHGTFVTQLQVFALLILYLLEVRGERGPVVKSVTTTSMAYRLGEIFQVPVHETAVGFKYIGPKMLQDKALIGGEESGGYGFRGHIPERDGILAGLYFLDLMIKLHKTPSQLIEYLYAKVGPHYYDRIDHRFPADQRQVILQRLSGKRPSQICGMPVTGVDTIDGFRFTLKDGSWLLIRFSGTEPILRIYAETSSPQRLQGLLACGKEISGA